MHETIENIIKKNLPEKTDERKVATFGGWQAETYGEKMLVNAVLDQINTSLIADEVLRVVGEKIKEEFGKTYQWYDYDGLLNKCCMSKDIEQLLSNLSNNEENKNNG